MSLDEDDEFQLVADCHHIECASRPQLHLLRHKLIPVNAGDFDFSVSAIRRKPGTACPFQDVVDACRAEAEASHEADDQEHGVYFRDGGGVGVLLPEGPPPTAADIVFSIIPWGRLCFLWPLRKDSEAYRMRKRAYFHRPQVMYYGEATDTGADLRRAVHETLLPGVRRAGIGREYDDDTRTWDEVNGTEYLQSCVTREEFEAHVAASMEALASFVDTHGGTFGAATIPGGDDPVTDDLWYEQDGGNMCHHIFGTQHWWYEVVFQTS
jgi:hypothetical protein